jgi:hypothetical protein
MFDVVRPDNLWGFGGAGNLRLLVSWFPGFLINLRNFGLRNANCGMAIVTADYTCLIEY